MASLGEILTAAQNLVAATNGYAQAFVNVNGAQSRAGLTGATVLKPTSGRVATVAVIVAGAASGFIYDANVTTNTTQPLFVIPMTIGVYVVNLPTNYGVTVAPGTGQTVTVSFS